MGQSSSYLNAMERAIVRIDISSSGQPLWRRRELQSRTLGETRQRRDAAKKSKQRQKHQDNGNMNVIPAESIINLAGIRIPEHTVRSLQALIDARSGPVVVCNSQLDIVLCNLSLSSLLCLQDQDELIGTSVVRLVDHESSINIRETIERFVTTRSMQQPVRQVFMCDHMGRLIQASKLSVSCVKVAKTNEFFLLEFERCRSASLVLYEDSQQCSNTDCSACVVQYHAKLKDFVHVPAAGLSTRASQTAWEDSGDTTRRFCASPCRITVVSLSLDKTISFPLHLAT